MDPRRKEALLWGVVGGLAFLVLLQGYELLAARPVDLLVKFGVALLVAVGAGALSYATRRRLAQNERH
jgi:hypothetical protein